MPPDTNWPEQTLSNWIIVEGADASLQLGRKVLKRRYRISAGMQLCTVAAVSTG